MQKRDDYWQAIRGISIIAVILIHCLSGIGYKDDMSLSWNYHYWLVFRQVINIPVAVFIFLAGYFAKIDEKNINEFSYCVKRGGKLLIPFIIWSIIYLCSQSILGNHNYSIKDAITAVITGRVSAQLYYILVLFQFVLLTPFLLSTINNKLVNIIAFSITPLFLLIIYLYQINTKSQMPNRELICFGWFVFYYMGLYIKNKGHSNNFSLSIIFLCLLVFAAIIFSIIETYTLLYYGVGISASVSFFKVSSFLYAVSFISLLLVVKKKIRSPKMLIEIGNCSYGIYFVHCMWLIVVMKIMSYIPFISNILPLYHIVQLTLTILFSIISIKITRKLIGEKKSSLLLGF